MVLRKVVIDDTDSRITYSGSGWFKDNGSLNNVPVDADGLPYNRTSHGTDRNGSLSFSFEGTSIDLLGTLIVEANNSEPTYECFVDNKRYPPWMIRTSPDIRNNWLFCNIEYLHDGPHTFEVKVKTNTITFWVDYLIFTPSLQASFDEAVLVVDVGDPGIRFNSGWKIYENKLITTIKGSQATFDFVGKSVTWVGFLPVDMPNSTASGSFSIDGGPSTSFVLNGIPVNWVANSLYNQEFFTTPTLDPGPHSLVVTYNGGDSGLATPLTLQCLYVTNTSTTRQLPSSPSSSSTLTSQPSPSASSPSNTSSLPKQGLAKKLGAIIGGVMGGLGLLVLVVFLLRRRHRRRNTKLGGGGSNSTPSPRVTPFNFLPSLTIAPRITSVSGPIPFVKPPLHPNNMSDPEGTAAAVTHPDRTVNHKGQTIITQPDVSSVQHQDTSRQVPPARAQESLVGEDMPPEYTTG